VKYPVFIETTATGFCAHVPDLPGCVATGHTLEELREMMRGAIEMHLEGMAEDGDTVPEPTELVEFIEVTAPAALKKAA
jgi:predicted RNase H-like HicB family nuclease